MMLMWNQSSGAIFNIKMLLNIGVPILEIYYGTDILSLSYQYLHYGISYIMVYTTKSLI